MSDAFIQMIEALETNNVYDLYDALADNGFETDEVWRNGSNAAWLASHIKQLLGMKQ